MTLVCHLERPVSAMESHPASPVTPPQFSSARLPLVQRLWRDPLLLSAFLVAWPDGGLPTGDPPAPTTLDRRGQ